MDSNLDQEYRPLVGQFEGKQFRNERRLFKGRRCLLAALLLAGTSLALFSNHQSNWKISSTSLNTVAQFQKCSIDNFVATGFPFLDSAAPLPVSEYELRRNNLAVALEADGVDAFVVEPGYTFKYYANVSQPEWEVWEPEERPFLMIVQPVRNKENGRIEAGVKFLAPSFEVERARLLGMPFVNEPKFVPWEEHWNPYQTLLKSWDIAKGRPKIMVDDEMRDFIQRGLGENGFEVLGLGGEVERVKQTKTQREVEIVRAVNTGTVEAVRAMRKCLYPGLTENEVMEVLDNTLRVAGMDPFFDIVLFGWFPYQKFHSILPTYKLLDEDASNPHGGTDGSKILEAETFVLIDVGAHLYGYSSDICRTFFPPFFPKPTTPYQFAALSPMIQEKLSVWDIVLEAQTQSMHNLVAGNSAASVDIAARKVITDAGYGKDFTHRVGHGIGIKAHESPYLNKGNVNTTLRAGMTFTSEPGIYLVDKFGVRHEDILLVKENGEPEILTGTRAVGPWDP
ncbi:hypothetical protein HYFRA_00007983 [Hymenoscyphus fraxineus]|uniref:Peptidase M24 domain-containing protein n=1 Tax=Hymenoscyphus fraxineus TaxID=746836 RepID=A0A9N9KPZ3_9HELO|nr:hypothetical protein HYFRA_00007983 [Hymenoscyphus fraxineus]